MCKCDDTRKTIRLACCLANCEVAAHYCPAQQLLPVTGDIESLCEKRSNWLAVSADPVQVVEL